VKKKILLRISSLLLIFILLLTIFPFTQKSYKTVYANPIDTPQIIQSKLTFITALLLSMGIVFKTAQDAQVMSSYVKQGIDVQGAWQNIQANTYTVTQPMIDITKMSIESIKSNLQMTFANPITIDISNKPLVNQVATNGVTFSVANIGALDYGTYYISIPSGIDTGITCLDGANIKRPTSGEYFPGGFTISNNPSLGVPCIMDLSGNTRMQIGYIGNMISIAYPMGTASVPIQKQVKTWDFSGDTVGYNPAGAFPIDTVFNPTLNPDATATFPLVTPQTKVGDIGTVETPNVTPSGWDGLWDWLKQILNAIKAIPLAIMTFFDLSKPLNLDKLKLSGELFTTKFPFSLPWDIKNGFTIMLAPQQAPNVPIDFSNTILKCKFVLDLSFATIIFQFIRTMEFLLFNIALIKITPTIVGGDR
jgi:hypothetical protein